MMAIRPTSRSTWLLLAAAFAVVVGLGCSSSDDNNDDNPIAPASLNVVLLGNAEGAPGDTTTILVSIENPDPLTGVQFDLLHDEAVFTVIEAVTTSRTSGFEVFHSAPEAGIARVLLTDLSGTAQLAAGSGGVVTLRVAIDPSAPVGASAMETADCIGTDVAATPVSLGSANGTFTVH